MFAEISASLQETVSGDGGNLPKDLIEPQELLAHILFPYLERMNVGLTALPTMPAEVADVQPFASFVMENSQISSLLKSDFCLLLRHILTMASDEHSFLTTAASVYGFKFKLDAIEAALPDFSSNDILSSFSSSVEGASAVSAIDIMKTGSSNAIASHQYHWSITDNDKTSHGKAHYCLLVCSLLCDHSSSLNNRFE